MFSDHGVLILIIGCLPILLLAGITFFCLGMESHANKGGINERL
jgi:hypothetical protein